MATCAALAARRDGRPASCCAPSVPPSAAISFCPRRFLAEDGPSELLGVGSVVPVVVGAAAAVALPAAGTCAGSAACPACSSGSECAMAASSRPGCCPSLPPSPAAAGASAEAIQPAGAARALLLAQGSAARRRCRRPPAAAAASFAAPGGCRVAHDSRRPGLACGCGSKPDDVSMHRNGLLVSSSAAKPKGRQGAG